MRIPEFSETWPESWRVSHRFDELELDDAQTVPYAESYRHRREVTLRLFHEFARGPARVLDVAAAQGNFSLALAELGYDVTWNDLREDLADYVRLKGSSEALKRLTFCPGNFLDLDAPLFDVVLAGEVIEHVAHPDHFLVALAAKLKPGGRLVLTTPNGAYFRNTLPKFSECADPSIYESVQFRPDADGHIFLLYPEELLEMAPKAGLRVVHLELFGNPLTEGHVKLHYVAPSLPRRWLRGVEQASRRLPNLLRRRVHAGMAACLVRES